MAYETEKDFPKRVFATIPEPGENGYMTHDEALEDVDGGDGTVVAEYELVRVGQLTVRKRLGALPKDS